MERTPETRLSLVEKIKDPGDVDAWNEFTAIYYPLIFDVCRRKGLQHADATDVTQEVLSRVVKAIDGYRHDQPNATFRGWLYRITRNLTVDFFRRRGKDPLATAASPTALHEIEKPSEAECREFQNAFRQKMFMVVAKTVQAQVAPKTWMVFWKTEFEGRDPEATAVELGMTRGAVYVARSRVIAKLRKEVQRRLDETNAVDSTSNSDPN